MFALPAHHGKGTDPLKILILGGGVTGLFLAFELLSRSDISVEVVIAEANPFVGGMAASFEYEGLYFDYGSHRLHATVSPSVIQKIKSVVGPDLLYRRRNGRIRLGGSFVKFPMNPIDMAQHFTGRFLAAILLDSVFKYFRPRRKCARSFADVLLKGLGETVCNAFYFPYARKLWGLDPEEIAADQARGRVSAYTTARILKKALSFIPGFGKRGVGHFFYPRRGFGQICDSIAAEVHRLGGRISLSSRIRKIRVGNGRGLAVVAGDNGRPRNVAHRTNQAGFTELRADMVFSTIPITDLVDCVQPQPSIEVANASQRLRYRGLVLLYLVLQTKTFTPFDTHYFPEDSVCFSRLSEPKNYSGCDESSGTTGLCVEIPCWVGDDHWNASLHELIRVVLEQLESSGLPVRVPVKTAFIRRLSHAYPLHDLNYKRHFRTVEKHLTQLKSLVVLGRQGVFVHDNTHHALQMASAASRCLSSDGSWDADKWWEYTKKFEAFVVED